ncbi:MAG: RagB/SusD family nutrient uptake outer membrane protein [Bacteroidales bacterium]|nr:RagB/SusD family nutrient uptake outer membrane protein [Bacteroidales bacterium]
MRRLAAYLVSLLALSACHFLDVEMKDNTPVGDFYRTQAEMESALRGVYAVMSEQQLYGDVLLCRMGLTADLGYENYTSDRGTVGYYQVRASDYKVKNYWLTLYKGIARANQILDYIDKPRMSDEDRNAIKGEALFLRAWYHYLLAVRFGAIPLVLTSADPEKLEALQVPRDPLDVVYAQIFADMREAADLVRDASAIGHGGRVSKSVVWGIMARVCLQAGGYPLRAPGMNALARDYAKKVIDLGFHELNPSYQDVFINLIQDRYDVKECLWEVEFYGNNVGAYNKAAGMVGRNNGISYTGTNPSIGISAGMLRPTGTYYKMFNKADLRRDWTISPYQYRSDGSKNDRSKASDKWSYFCGKFRREYELSEYKHVSSYSGINFPLLRYSDVLLMFAEAVAADPNNDDAADFTLALECLNRVRRRGYGKPVTTPDASVDLAVSTKADLLAAVKTERALELGFELLRKDDLVRWGEFLPTMKATLEAIPASYTSTQHVSARLFYTNAEARDVLWPIPSTEISADSLLEQNEGWNDAD